jgi:hypothetical protein
VKMALDRGQRRFRRGVHLHYICDRLQRIADRS